MICNIRFSNTFYLQRNITRLICWSVFYSLMYIFIRYIYIYIYIYIYKINLNRESEIFY